MTKTISLILAAFFAGLAVGFFIQLRKPAPIPTGEIKAAMIEAAGEIDLNPPAVNMQVQTLELGELDKLKLREFTYSPTFCADVIDLDGQTSRGIADSLVFVP